MRSTKVAPASFGKFKKSRPMAVTLPQQELVGTSFIEGAGEMPVVLTPNIDDVDVVDWAAGSRELLEEKVTRHGAVLFRGFSIDSVPRFEALAAAVCPSLFGEYGDLPNEDQGKKVYKSTPYPADKIILFHNESSHMHRWPLRQFFYSAKVAAERGETPIVDCREIYRRLDPEIRDRFERLGLSYVRNFVEGLDVTWQEFFCSDDKTYVEDYCRRCGTEFEWLEGNGLRTRQRCPAVTVHPKTGEKVFFNQIQLHHSSFLGPEVRQSLLSIYGEKGLPRNVYYGDGTPIEDSIAQEVCDLYWKCSVQFPWQLGDVLMVDNMIVAHARNPFVGERKIVVAMGALVELGDVA